MADNFDLRQFLTENKLTKNTQLLAEGSDYGYEVLMDVVDTEYDGDPAIAAAVEDAFHNGDIDTSEFGHDLNAPSNAVAQIANGMDIEAAQQSMGFEEGVEGEEGRKNEETIQENDPGSIYYIAKSATTGKYIVNKASKHASQTITGNQKFKTEAEAQAEADRKNEETVKENTMTQRDRYLTRLVENALGLNVTEDDNVDYTMGRQDDPNQLPNPAPELNIPEGEDMVQEKPLPKYENIEKLMQEIEHGTNEAACKYKMDEMKRVYEALEKKVSSLEEGEHAEYTDKKAINQMRKDIVALRKAEEKLRKDFDKKFNKEKKEAPKKEKEEVTLAEGNFDLRKFLVENRK